MDLLAEIESVGRRMGLSRVGVCAVEPFSDVRDDIESRVDSGLSGGLTFTFSDPSRSTDLSRSLPWARRLVVGGRAYLPEGGNPGPRVPGTARVARFATADHYVPLRAALHGIAVLLASAGHRVETLVDDNRLVDRAAAVRAGIGWWGKNTMVLAPGQGPWMLIGSVATDAPLPVSRPMVRDCGTCEACLPACPTGALIAPGILDARLCLAAIAQRPGWIPVELREPMGDRLYGCDDCIEACPPGSRLLERSGSEAGRVDLREVLALSDEELLSCFAHFYVPRRNARYLRRNALVALGNTGTGRHVAVAARHLDDPDPLIRGHAAWALGRIGGNGARRALEERRRVEADERVR